MRKTLFSLIVLFLTSCSNNLSSSMVAPLSSSSNVDYSKMVRVVACSDYQDDRGHIKSQENVLDIWLTALIIMIPNAIPLIQNYCLNILDAMKKRLFRSIVLLSISVLNIF